MNRLIKKFNNTSKKLRMLIQKHRVTPTSTRGKSKISKCKWRCCSKNLTRRKKKLRLYIMKIKRKLRNLSKSMPNNWKISKEKIKNCKKIRTNCKMKNSLLMNKLRQKIKKYYVLKRNSKNSWMRLNCAKLFKTKCKQIC